MFCVWCSAFGPDAASGWCCLALRPLWLALGSSRQWLAGSAQVCPALTLKQETGFPMRDSC